MIYVLIATKAAENLSKAIYQLMRPPHLRDNNDVSAYYCDWIVSLDPNWSVLVLPENDIIPIHVEADGVLLNEILDVFVNDQALTQQEANDIIQKITSSAGSSINISNLIPLSWQPYVMTYEQAKQAGYINELI